MWHIIAPRMNLYEIETERLRLRPFTTEDAGALHRLWTEPGVRKYLWDDEVIQRERVDAVLAENDRLFAEKGYGLWAVLPRSGGELAGFCGYWHFREPPELELLYGIAPALWGQGLAPEAALAMIRFGFERLGFERIAASTDAPHAASVRVMEKAGLRFESRFTHAGLDTLRYVLDRADFRPDGSTYAVRLAG